VTRFWLVRHGEPEVRRPNGLCVGREVDLSEVGRAQVAKVAEYLKPKPIAAILSSPLKRALESARILGAILAVPVEVVRALREIDFGDFESLSHEDIAVQYPDIYKQWMKSPVEVHFPKGECQTEVRERVLCAFEAICRQQEGRDVVIVSHRGVIRIIIAWALRIPDDCVLRLSQGHAAVNCVEVFEDFTSVELLNYCQS
jgi:phosphoserine phosphatase